MQIIIYSKAQCPNCDSAKALLKSKGLEFEEQNVKDPRYALGFAVFVTENPQARQLPQIFIDGQRVGGLAGLQQALKQVGL